MDKVDKIVDSNKGEVNTNGPKVDNVDIIVCAQKGEVKESSNVTISFMGPAGKVTENIKKFRSLNFFDIPSHDLGAMATWFEFWSLDR